MGDFNGTMIERYDTVVLGGGLGGLVAAAELSRKGHRVLVLEKHYKPGGAAGSFKRGGYHFDQGLHAVNGGHSSDPVMRFFHRHRLDQKLDLINLPEYYKYQSGEVTLTVAGDYKKAVSAFVSRFPSEKKSIRKYFKLLKKTADRLIFFSRLSPLLKLILFPLILCFVPLTGPLLTKRLGQILDRFFKSDELKKALTANFSYFNGDPVTIGFGFYAVAYMSFLRSGAFYIRGGSGRLAEELVKVVKKGGGDVFVRHDVFKVEITARAVVSVICRDLVNHKNIQVKAPRYIVNLSPHHFFKMTGLQGRALPSSARRLMAMEPSTSLFSLYLGFKKGYVYPQDHAYSTFIYKKNSLFCENTRTDKSDSAREYFSNCPFVFCDYGTVDSGLSDDGVFVAVICCVDDEAFWKGLTADEYKKKKAEVSEILIERLEKSFPGISSYIDYRECATALTVKRYLNTPGCAVYGYKQTPSQFAFRRAPVRGIFKNTFFASAWGQPGGGFSAVMTNGVNAAKEAAS